MADAASLLRDELAQSRQRGGRGFPVSLRSRVASWAVEQRKTGTAWKAIALQLGVSSRSIRVWVASEPAKREGEPGGFIAVVPTSAEPEARKATGPVLHGPCGYQVTGLQLADLVAVLRGLE
jgi:hypothetical protein